MKTKNLELHCNEKQQTQKCQFPVMFTSTQISSSIRVVMEQIIKLQYLSINRKV